MIAISYNTEIAQVVWLPFIEPRDRGTSLGGSQERADVECHFPTLYKEPASCTLLATHCCWETKCESLCADSAGSVTRRVEDALWQLHLQRVAIPDSGSLRAYLADHPDTVDALSCLGSAAARRFGERSQVSLELYRDPEVDDEYLTLYVRQEDYDQDILDQIDDVSERCEASLQNTSGWVLLTTDFRPPR